MNLNWKHFAPIIVAVVIALFPPPEGLSQHAWYFFAIFAGVIVGLMFEPLPGGAIGLIGVILVAVRSQQVLWPTGQYPADKTRWRNCGGAASFIALVRRLPH